MTSPIDERPRGRRRFQVLASVFVSTALAAGVTLAVLGGGTASAASQAITQCNGINDTPGLTTTCSVTVINTLTDDPATTNSVVTQNGATTTYPGIIVTSVTQCNSSSRGGGGTLNCSVDIINNIAMNGAAAAGTATISQCNGNQPDGLGTAPNTCSPVANTGTGATIFQCNNRTGNGGGLVNVEPLYSHCTASGSVSASLPVTVNQCNEDSADGGGGRVHCTVSITSNVVNTATVAVTPSTTPSISSLGTVGVTRSGVTRPTAIESSPRTTG